METVARPWNRFWFPEVPVERLAIFRIAVTVFALVDVAFVSTYVRDYPRIDPQFMEPVYLLRPFDGPVLTPGAYLVMTGVLVVALAAAAGGAWTRMALVVAAPLYLYHWALFNSFGKVNHGKIPVVVALFVLVVAPAGARWSVDAWRRRRAGRPPATDATDPVAGWALQVVAVTIVAAYVLSVYSKLTNTGLGWVLEPILQTQLLVADGALAGWLVDRPGVLAAAQAATLVVEALSVLLLWGDRRVRYLVLAALAGFHLGSYVLLETEFSGFLVCYLVFFRTERVVEWWRARRDPGSDSAASVPAGRDRVGA